MWLLLSPNPKSCGGNHGAPQLRNTATPSLLLATTTNATNITWYVRHEVRYALGSMDGSSVAGIWHSPCIHVTLVLLMNALFHFWKPFKPRNFRTLLLFFP